MACKLFVLTVLVAVARAGIIGTPAVVAPGPTIARATPIAYTTAPASGRAITAPVAIARAAPVPIAASVARAVTAPIAVDTDYDPNPQYSYAYDVQDVLTGDSKSQQESRSGDVVHGSYSLVESDGTRRIVDYIADPVNGFNAVVHREPAVTAAAVAQAPVAVAAPITRYAAVAAPVARNTAVPAVAYAAPVARTVADSTVAYAAPGRFAYGAAGVPTKAIQS